VTASKIGFILSALVAAPVFAQTTVDVPPGTTTTVQSQPQQQPPPPSTTVEVQQAPQPAPQQPGTQVVVNPQPQPAPAAPPPPSQVTRYDTTDIVETHPHRPAMVTIATDALYGGVAGVLIGGGVALIGRDGDNWARDLTIGAGAGLLVGGAIGVVEAVSDANDHPARRAAADVRTDGGSAPSALAFSYGGRF